MTDQQILEGDWNALKCNLRNKWVQLTDSDLPQVRGDMEHLIGIIQRKTGEGREVIESYLRQLPGSAATVMGAAAERVRNCTQQATDSVQHTAQQASDSLHAGYKQAERIVRGRPAESLLVCFGVGLITGVVVALSLRSR